MTHWNTLLQAALVGTARQPMPSPEGMPGAFGDLLRAIPVQDQGQLLRAAGAMALGRRAGYVAAELPAAERPAAPPDQRAVLDAHPALQAAMADALALGPLRLQHAALSALSTAGYRLPPGLLPAALDAGRRAVDLRPAVIAALGERGLWLAAHNDDWHYATGASEQADVQTRWDEGSLEQRRAVLVAQRRGDPAGARERLQAELPQLPAKDRALLLGTLAENLGADDEALLDAQLKDRGREVRQTAAGLLQRLPASAHVGRITAVLAPLLLREGGIWRLQAPEAADPRWKDDAIEATRPAQDSLGERAWWLYQLVRQTPLAWWTAHTGMSPAALLDWASLGDWNDALMRGWNEAVLAAPDHDWCDAMLERPRSQRTALAHLLALLPRHRRERHWGRQLETAGGLQDVVGLAEQACALGETLTPELSGRLAAGLRASVEQGQLANDYVLRHVLSAAALLLHADALVALADLPRTADETPGLADALNECTRVVRARALFSTLSSSSSFSSSPQGHP